MEGSAEVGDFISFSIDLSLDWKVPPIREAAQYRSGRGSGD